MGDQVFLVRDVASGLPDSIWGKESEAIERRDNLRGLRHLNGYNFVLEKWPLNAPHAGELVRENGNRQLALFDEKGRDGRSGEAGELGAFLLGLGPGEGEPAAAT